MAFKIEIEGLDNLAALLDPVKLRKGISRGLDRWARMLENDLGKYPVRTVASYQRTGRLGRSWSTRKDGPLNRRVSSKARYAHWVMGKGQTAAHKQRWPRAGDKLQRTKRRGLQILQDEIRTVFDR